MSKKIHSTAIISKGANIADDVIIGPYCVIGDNVTIHSGSHLKSHVCVDGYTDVGENCIIYPFASLGHAPQDLKYNGEKTRLKIGNNNKIREHVTMNPGTIDDNSETVVGDNCLFMVGAHVAHDCRIGNNVIMANNATLGGHVHVGNFVVVGGLSAVHQFIRIGSYAIIGGFSGVESDVIPYGRVKGERAFLAGLNLIGLERQGIDKERVKVLQKAYAELFQGDGTLEDRLKSVEQKFGENDAVQNVLEFAKSKNKFPLCQPQKRA